MTKQISNRHGDAIEQLGLPIGVALTDVSLEAPQTLDDEQIVDLGRKLRRIQNASAWWVADYIVFVQQLFAGNGRPRRDTYDRVQKLWPQYSRSTLQTYASIARRVPAKLRSSILSFDHHTHIATLFEEKNADVMQAHYIKVAERAEATAEDLRLMIADTRKGIASEKPKRGRPMKQQTIDISASEDSSSGSVGAHVRIQADDGLPIPREPEPELMTGSHAQLASDAQRALTRLRGWYAAKARKETPADWPDERKAVLVADLKPVLNEMHAIADIFGALTNAEQTGDYAQ